MAMTPVEKEVLEHQASSKCKAITPPKIDRIIDQLRMVHVISEPYDIVADTKCSMDDR